MWWHSPLSYLVIASVLALVVVIVMLLITTIPG
jgi:hypothetical protein